MNFVEIDNDLPQKEKCTLALIIILFICFWAQFFFSERFVESLMLAKFSFSQLISHQFIHVHSMHLIINIVLLYISGKIIETRIGVWFFFPLFIIFGICGGISHLTFSKIIAAGASGGISGFIGLAFVLDFKNKVYFFDRKIILPVWLMGGFWFVKDLFFLMIPSMRTGPAAHLGAFVAGVVLGLIILGAKKSFAFDIS